MDTLALFASIVVAVFLEAAPFLLLGALLGALVEVYVPTEGLLRLLPAHPLAGIGLGVAAGLFLPTCECGVVPIARRLLAKGVPGPIALTYMLSAPVFNPVVLVSTYIAFRGRPGMLFGRLGLVLIPAVLLGAFLGGGDTTELLRTSAPPKHDEPAHPARRAGPQARGGRLLAVFRHTGTDFLDMGRFLLLGAVASALFKSVVPGRILSAFTGEVLVSVGIMMLLAILLSVCSEADAFVAASFGAFPPIAQLAFVSVGPMVDIKLISMYASVFRRPVAIRLIHFPIVLIYGLAVFAGGYLGFGA